MNSSRLFRETGPGLLNIQKGGGLMTLFGLPFLLAGIGLAAAVFRLIAANSASKVPEWTWLSFLAMSATFIAIGGGFVFGRSWTTLDATRGVVCKEWRLLVPIRRREYFVASYSSVLLSFVAGGSDSADSFPVSLKARSGPNLGLCTSATYPESRENATAAASFLHLPLEDATTDHPSVLAPEQAGQSLTQLLRSGKLQTEKAIPPPSLRSEVREADGSVRISIPGAAFNPGIVIGAAGMAIALMLAANPIIRLYWRTETHDGVKQYIAVGMVVIFGILPALAFLRARSMARRARTLVTVSPAGIVIEDRRTRKTQVNTLAASDILDIDYSTVDSMLASTRRELEVRALQSGQPVPGENARTMRLLAAVLEWTKSRGITVKCRQGLFTFGAGLGSDEVRYLHSIIKRTLGGEDAGRSLDHDPFHHDPFHKEWPLH